MTKVQRAIVTTAAAVFLVLVLGVGGVWLLGAVHTARSPEAKCQKVLDDLRADPRYANASESSFQAGYQACLQSERSGQ